MTIIEHLFDSQDFQGESPRRNYLVVILGPREPETKLRSPRGTRKSHRRSKNDRLSNFRTLRVPLQPRSSHYGPDRVASHVARPRCGAAPATPPPSCSYRLPLALHRGQAEGELERRALGAEQGEVLVRVRLGIVPIGTITKLYTSSPG